MCHRHKIKTKWLQMLKGMHARHLEVIDEATARQIKSMTKRRGAVQLYCFMMLRRIKIIGLGWRRWTSIVGVARAEESFKVRLHSACQTPLKGLPLTTEVEAHHCLLPKAKFPPRTPHFKSPGKRGSGSAIGSVHKSGKSIALIRRRMELDAAQRDLRLLLGARDTVHIAEWKS